MPHIFWATKKAKFSFVYTKQKKTCKRRNKGRKHGNGFTVEKELGQLNPFADFCAEVGHRVYFLGSRCFPSSEKLTMGLRSILKVSGGRQVALYNVFISCNHCQWYIAKFNKMNDNTYILYVWVPMFEDVRNFQEKWQNTKWLTLRISFH